ncbi:MAG: Clp protease ClpP [Cyanobacteria bacterium REEB67]|nr:Clp protease ClpP [Cyanobacteria bacterium REEB67]
MSNKKKTPDSTPADKAAPVAAPAATPAAPAAAKNPLDDQLKGLQVKQAEIALQKARRAEIHEVQMNAADLRRLQAVAATAELDLAKKRRDAARELAAADEALNYTFYDGVSDESIKPALAELGKWSRRCPGQPITITLNSGGGSVIAGLALFDYILKLRADGHHVTVICLGMAASMGGILLQAGDKRIVGRYAQVLIHEVSAGTSGNIQKMDDALTFSKSLWNQLSEILAERSTMTVAQVRKAALRKDWWLTSQETVDLGFADEVLSAPFTPKVQKGGKKPASKAKGKAKSKKAE